MKHKKRLIYFAVGIITVLAIFTFLRIALKATASISDQNAAGTLDVAAMQANADKHIALLATTSELVTASSTATTSTPLATSSPVVKAIKVPPIIPAFYPVRLKIPSLGIDANVQELGINKKGALGVPSNFTDVGWYAAGTIPGDKGSAIMDGHVDNGLALAGVFKHLVDIAVGDSIYVTEHDGTVIHFIVTGTESFDYMNAPTDLIFNQNNGSYLKLITCGGAWVPGGRTYDRRIVVTAVLATV